MATTAKRGTGSIFFDKSKKRWAVVFSINGVPVRKRFTDEKAAQIYYAQTRAELLRGTFIPPTNITVGEWVVEWLETYVKPTVREKTLQRYTQTAAHLEPIAAYKLQDLTSGIIQHLLNSLTLSNNSKTKVLKLLSASIKCAMQNEMITRNPCVAIKLPKVIQKEVEIFSQEEIAKLLGKLPLAKGNYAGLKTRFPLILLAVTTGARLGELLALEWSDIDLRAGTVSINKSLQSVSGKLRLNPPKTAAGMRTIPIPKETVKELQKLRKSEVMLPIDGKRIVFHNKVNNYIIPNNIEESWHRILRFCEIDYKKFHTLRHTHATMLLAAGVPLLEVAYRLGHSKASHTLDLYGHKIPGYNNITLQKLDLMYGK